MKLSCLMSLLSVACVLIFSQTALAADGAQSFDWTGPYAGVHLGYGWGDPAMHVDPLPHNFVSPDQAPSKMHLGPTGIVGGVQAGYNYQMGRFVAGIEADFSGSAMSGSQSVSPIPFTDGSTFPGSVSAHEETNWFGTLRPRLGYTVTPTLLIYGTGGLAYGNVSYSANTNFAPPGTATYPASFSKTQVGWTAGGGVEYAFSKRWTVKAEYLYMNLGSASVIARPVSPNPPYTEGYTWNTTANIFNIGVNYRF
ncbi:MAG: outer membrane protein [Syntrophobacteraceae bacterium]